MLFHTRYDHCVHYRKKSHNPMTWVLYFSCYMYFLQPSYPYEPQREQQNLMWLFNAVAFILSYQPLFPYQWWNMRPMGHIAHLSNNVKQFSCPQSILQIVTSFLPQGLQYYQTKTILKLTMYIWISQIKSNQSLSFLKRFLFN